MATIIDFVTTGLTTNRTMERLNSSVFSSNRSSTTPTIRDYSINATTPTERSGHTIVYFSGDLYMFGGTDTTGTFQSDLWRLNLTTNMWTQLAPTGTPLSARAGHGMFVFNSKIYILAGNSATGYLADLTVYDPIANSWNAVIVPGSLPIRAYFAYCMVGTSLYVLGGMRGTGGNSDYDDVRELNLALATPVWTLKRNGAFPDRCKFSAVAIGTLIYFHSGVTASGNNLRTDTRVYNTVTNTNSTLINTTGVSPGGRIAYNMAVSGAMIYLYGGSNLSTIFNTVHVLDTTTSVWSLVESTELSYGRCLAASAQNGSILYIDDGATTITGTANCSETWSMDLSLHTKTQLLTKEIYVGTTSFTYLGVTFSVFLHTGKVYIRMIVGSVGSTLSLKGLRINV